MPSIRFHIMGGLFSRPIFLKLGHDLDRESKKGTNTSPKVYITCLIGAELPRTFNLICTTTLKSMFYSLTYS